MFAARAAEGGSYEDHSYLETLAEDEAHSFVGSKVGQLPKGVLCFVKFHS